MSIFGMKELRKDAQHGGEGDDHDDIPPLLSWKAHRSWISGVALLHGDAATQRQLLLTTANDASMRIWDLSKMTSKRSAEEISSIDGIHSGGIFSLHYNHHGSLIATGSKDWTVTLSQMRLSTVTPIHRYESHSSVVKCVQFHPHKPWIASVGNDRAVKVLDYRVKEKSFSTHLTIPDAHPQVINCVCWRPGHDTQLMTCGADPVIRLFDTRKPREPVHTYEGHNERSKGKNSIMKPIFLGGEGQVCL